MSELQLVETILVGLSPEERSRLVLVNRPTSFAELEQCCIHASNVWYADQNRHNTSSFQSPKQTRHLQSETRNPRREQNFSQLQSKYYRATQNSHPVPGNSSRNECNSNDNHDYRNSGIGVDQRSSLKCYQCGKLGHVQRNCYRNQKVHRPPNQKNA